MRHRVALPSCRLHAAAVASVLLLSACTAGTADPSDPTTTPRSAATPSPSDETAQPTASATDGDSPESAAEEAYRRYLDTTVAAMESGDPARIEAARDQALAAAEARVASLTAQDRVARGAFRPAVQSLEVDGDAAQLRDCYAADLTEHDRDTDEQVADRGGTRFAAEARLERTDDGWTVTEFNQGDTCVPDELADEIEDRYLAFWAAVNTAGRPPDPDHPDLLDAAAGEQLDGLQKQLTAFREAGEEVRDETVSHPEAVRISSDDTVAMVRDCRDLDPDGGIYDSESGELVRGGAEPGQRDLWETRLELVAGKWRVVDADQIEEDSGCEPATSS